MEGNDIAPFATIAVGTLWEGVLASPPAPRKRRFHRDQVEFPLKEWEPHELPLKSVVDCIHRRGIQVDVYTCLGEAAVGPIDEWLSKKGIHTVVQAWDSIEEMGRDLRFNPGVRSIFVASWAQARIVGFRATVAPADREWPL